MSSVYNAPKPGQGVVQKISPHVVHACSRLALARSQGFLQIPEGFPPDVGILTRVRRKIIPPACIQPALTPHAGNVYFLGVPGLPQRHPGRSSYSSREICHVAIGGSPRLLLGARKDVARRVFEDALVMFLLCHRGRLKFMSVK